MPKIVAYLNTPDASFALQAAHAHVLFCSNYNNLILYMYNKEYKYPYRKFILCRNIIEVDADLVEASVQFRKFIKVRILLNRLLCRQSVFVIDTTGASYLSIEQMIQAAFELSQIENCCIVLLLQSSGRFTYENFSLHTITASIANDPFGWMQQTR